MKVKTKKVDDDRPYRLGVPLPRELSLKLEALKREAMVKNGKRVSKSSLVVEIVREFFQREDSCLPEDQE